MDKLGIPYKDELFQKYYTLTELIQDKTRQEVKMLMEIRISNPAELYRKGIMEYLR
ncbi:MAG: hypothetical protein IKN58_04405 [Prevotella sp.]|nr:hypothetical protein [Prevotella sp.]